MKKKKNYKIVETHEAVKRIKNRVTLDGKNIDHVYVTLLFCTKIFNRI